ncbi:RHS repeat protein, partial [Chitinivorax sp. B]|uniref:RHS repeat protein n=1 Tax=Chitinivorax sp. B TaxID=2502235 RepID=UPI0010F929B4
NAIHSWQYFDAAGRMVGTIDQKRMLTLLTYDARGNKTSEQRMGNAVPQGVDPASLTGNFNALSALVGTHHDDWLTTYTYDGANRLLAQYDRGTLINKYAYDALGNRSFTQDGNGRTTHSLFDGKGRQLKTIGVDGSGTVARYDAEGNRTFVYTGEMPNQAALPTNVFVEQGVAVRINWQFADTTPGGRSWVVYDTHANVDIDAYAHRIGEQLATQGHHVAELPKPVPGTQLYFRVVSQDAAGNLTWSEEQVLTVAAQYDQVEVHETGTGGVRFRVHFEAGVSNPTLHINGGPALTLSPVGGGYFQVEDTQPRTLNPSFSYIVKWQDASGKQQTGVMQTLSPGNQRSTPASAMTHEVANPHVGVASDYVYKLVLNTRFDAGQTAGLQLIMADWRPVGSSGPVRTTSVLARDSGQTQRYQLVAGSAAEPVAVGDYDIVLRGMRADGSLVELDRFQYRVTALPAPSPDADPSQPISSPPMLVQHVSWRNPHDGFTGQWIVVDGRLQQGTQHGETTILEGRELSVGSHDLDVYYTQQVAPTRDVNVTATQATHLEQVNQSTGYRLDIDASLPADQRAATAGGVFIAYGRFGNRVPTDPLAAGFSRQALQVTGDRIAGGVSGLDRDFYSYILYGLDAAGQVTLLQQGQLIVKAGSVSSHHPIESRLTYTEQFVQVNVEQPTPDTYHLDYAVTFSAAEMASLQGPVTVSYLDRTAGGVPKTVVLSRDGHQFKGRLPDLRGVHELKAYYTDQSGRTVIVDWREHAPGTGFSNQTHSTVVVAKEQGIRLDKDPDGLHVVNGVYLGPQRATQQALALSVLSSGLGAGQRLSDGRNTGYYVETRFDALGHKVASNETDGIWREYGVDQAGNAVSTTLYDKAGGSWQGNQLAEYDGRGRKVAEWGAAYTAHSSSEDTTGHRQRDVTRYRYHRNDQVTDQVSLYRDLAGNGFDGVLDSQVATRQRTVFDAAGQKVASIDALGNTVQFQYDEVGRQIGSVDARRFRSWHRYDGLGNLVEEVNGGGDRTQYEYDTLGRRTALIDGLGRRTQQTWSGDRLLAKGALRFDYDAVGNRIATTQHGVRTVQDYDGLGRVIATHTWVNGEERIERRAYDVYGNLVGDSNLAGHGKAYSYGAFNRLQWLRDETGLVTYYDYDGLGRQIREHNREGRDIRKAYDAAGHLLSVKDVGIGTETLYRYDDTGRKFHERFEGQGQRRYLVYQYDAQGRQVAWRDYLTDTASRSELDANGNLTRIWHDGVGQAFDRRYEFDGNNRVTRDSHGDGRLVHAFRYDAVGNRIEDHDGQRTIHYRYDDQNRVTQARWYGSVNAQAAAAGFTDLGVFSGMLGITDHTRDSVQLSAGPQTVTLDSASPKTLRLLAQHYLGDGELWQRLTVAGWYKPADTTPRFDRNGIEIPPTACPAYIFISPTAIFL